VAAIPRGPTLYISENAINLRVMAEDIKEETEQYNRDMPTLYAEDLEEGICVAECECCGDEYIENECGCNAGLKVCYLGDGELGLECYACGMPIAFVKVANNPAKFN
jgi:hypothetical protein